MSAERHDPQFLNGHRHGAWATCSCGWKSSIYVGLAGAFLAHGEHLVEIEGENE